MGTTKSSIKSLKPGKYCVIDDEPCIVKSVSSSVAGKHGGAKTRLEARGLFDSRFRTIVKPSDADVEVPLVDKRTGQVVAIVDEVAQIMDLETYETFDSSIPDDLKDKVTQGTEVIYWIIMGRKMIIQAK